MFFVGLNRVVDDRVPFFPWECVCISYVALKHQCQLSLDEETRFYD